MAEAPKSRGFGSLLGKSLGMAVEGVMPELARNKTHPDAADRTGQPWPDDATDAPDETVVQEEFDYAAAGSGITFDLPEGHMWDVAVDIVFTAEWTAYTDEPRRVRATFTSSTGGGISEDMLPSDDREFSEWPAGTTGLGPFSTVGGYRIGGLAVGPFHFSAAVGAGHAGTVTDSGGTIKITARWNRPLTSGEMP